MLYMKCKFGNIYKITWMWTIHVQGNIYYIYKLVTGLNISNKNNTGSKTDKHTIIVILIKI